MGGSPTHIESRDGGTVVRIEGGGAHKEQLIHRHSTMEDVLKAQDIRTLDITVT